MKVSVTTAHNACETCKNCADNAILGVRLTGAERVGSYNEDCFAEAFVETEDTYASVWG
jgi:hypothetical protein